MRHTSTPAVLSSSPPYSHASSAAQHTSFQIHSFWLDWNLQSGENNFLSDAIKQSAPRSNLGFTDGC